MIDVRTIGLAPVHIRYALGYACTCAWAVVLLLSPAFGAPGSVHATSVSMIPGLFACLGSILFSRKFPSIAGRTAFVTAAALLMAAGTLLCTYPPAAAFAPTRIAGLALSGFFAIILIMSWFDTYARLNPRAIIVLAGCAISIAALLCWIILACPAPIASTLVVLLPFISLITLPSAKKSRQRATETSERNQPSTCEEASNHTAAPNREARAHEALTAKQPTTTSDPGFLDIMAAAVPLRTLVGLAITFFIVSSIGSLAPEFGFFSKAVTPWSLLIPLSITVFFIASALLVHHRIDPSILYKILLSAFAAGVFLLMLSIGTSAALVFYANIVADVMMWIVLALWAKRTPVKPHLVFAIGWIAECVGNTLGQTLAPLFAIQIQVFYVVALMLILVAVGFAFSEGHLMLDIDFQDDEGGQQARISNVVAAHDSTTAPTRDGTPTTNGSTAATAHGSTITTNNEPVSAAGYDVLTTAAKQGDPENDPLNVFTNAHNLSPREGEVFALWITGHGLKYIENALFISESTVKSHLRSIYRKCDTHNRAEIIALFERENGLDV